MPGGKAVAVDLIKRARVPNWAAEDPTGGMGTWQGLARLLPILSGGDPGIEVSVGGRSGPGGARGRVRRVNVGR